MGDQLRDYGGQVSDCRRSRRVQRLSLEKDALSFLHPRVVLHQLRVEERILRDDVLDPLDQAVCGESRVQKVALFSPPLGGHSQRWKTWTRGICFRPAYLQHYGPRGPCSRDFSWICGLFIHLWCLFGHIKS